MCVGGGGGGGVGRGNYSTVYSQIDSGQPGKSDRVFKKGKEKKKKPYPMREL